jgi:hypothetical protein
VFLLLTERRMAGHIRDATMFPTYTTSRIDALIPSARNARTHSAADPRASTSRTEKRAAVGCRLS